MNEAITGDGVGDTHFEFGKAFEMASRPGVEAIDLLIDELLPMPEQTGMRVGARLQIVPPFHTREPPDEAEESVDVVAPERRHRHYPVDPLDDQRNPVTVVEHTDELRSRDIHVETGEDLSLSSMHLRRHRVEFRAGRLDEDDPTIRQPASCRRAGREPAVDVDGIDDPRARNLVDRRPNTGRHVVPR